MPSPKPPFPAEAGLFGKPTVINNVEDARDRARRDADGSPGLRGDRDGKIKGHEKRFALTGHVANTGLIEVPFGTDAAADRRGDIGGRRDKRRRGRCAGVDFKAVQIGGPSGGCLTKETPRHAA